MEVVRIYARRVPDGEESRRRRQQQAARALLELGLREEGYAGALPGELPRGAHGKPYLPDPGAPQVNWSHSGDWALLALADRAVGIDLQQEGREPSPALAERLLTQEERGFYEAAPKERRRRLFYEYWVLKESFLKAVGTGFAISLDRFYIDLRRGSPIVHQTINDRSYHCRLLRFGESGYVAAVCCEGEEPDGRIRYVP